MMDPNVSKNDKASHGEVSNVKPHGTSHPKLVMKGSICKTVARPSRRLCYYYCGDLFFCTREGPLKRHCTMDELVAAYRSRPKKRPAFFRVGITPWDESRAFYN